MRMSHDDFCRCTPSEFQAVFDQWQQREANLDRGMWERVRLICMCILQPYSKKALSPSDIMELPWDKDSPQDDKTQTSEQVDESVIRERFMQAKSRYGLK